MGALVIISYLFVFALVITAVSGLVLRTHGPWGSYWPTFLLIFLFVWVVSLWTEPIGPVYYGVSWIPIVFAAVIIIILLAAVTPSNLKDRKFLFKRNRDAQSSSTVIALGFFFWIVILILILAVVAKYFA